MKTNMGPQGLIVRTRVRPVETWELLAHSSLVSGFALTTTLFPDLKRRSTSLHALQNLIMMCPSKTLQHKYLMSLPSSEAAENLQQIHTSKRWLQRCWSPSLLKATVNKVKKDVVFWRKKIAFDWLNWHQMLSISGGVNHKDANGLQS